MILDEVRGLTGRGEPDLPAIGAWLQAAAGRLDLAAARAETVRTGRAVMVEDSGDGPVLALRWFPPGEATTVHGHLSWGVVHVLEGSDRYERFEGHRCSEVRDLVAGDTVWFASPPDDVHRQTGTGGGALELLLLGRHPDRAPLDERIAAWLRAGDAAKLAALYAPDALLDVNVPQWRFQLQGPEAIEAVLREEEFAVARRRVTWWRATPTTDGLIIEAETRFEHDGEERLWRNVHIVRTDGERITSHTVYCTGIWDAATIARQAREAPMVRP